MSNTVINWNVNPDKIKLLSQNLIDETRKRCNDVINAEKKEENVLTVRLIIIILLILFLNC